MCFKSLYNKDKEIKMSKITLNDNGKKSRWEVLDGDSVISYYYYDSDESFGESYGKAYKFSEKIKSIDYKLVIKIIELLSQENIIYFTMGSISSLSENKIQQIVEQALQELKE